MNPFSSFHARDITRLGELIALERQISMQLENCHWVNFREKNRLRSKLKAVQVVVDGAYKCVLESNPFPTVSLRPLSPPPTADHQ